MKLTISTLQDTVDQLSDSVKAIGLQLTAEPEKTDEKNGSGEKQFRTVNERATTPEFRPNFRDKLGLRLVSRWCPCGAYCMKNG